LQESPRERFRHSFARIKDEAPTATNGTTENIMQQQGGPTTNITRGKHTVGNPSAHMKPRQPIVDNDYDLEQIDEDAAMFLLSSYDHATVVNIDGHVLTAEQLRRNVTGAFIADEVISFQIHVVIKYNHAHTYYVLTQPFAGHKYLCSFQQCGY
jgi:hypothetical protein